MITENNSSVCGRGANNSRRADVIANVTVLRRGWGGVAEKNL